MDEEESFMIKLADVLKVDVTVALTIDGHSATAARMLKAYAENTPIKIEGFSEEFVVVGVINIPLYYHKIASEFQLRMIKK